MLVAGAIALGIATFGASALAEPVRILVSAGSKLGLAAERPLKFAGTDAARVRDVVVSLGGVKPEHAFVLAEPSRALLFAAIDRARTEAQKHKTDEVTLIFYFSGHGDHDAIHLGDDRVLLTDLSAKLAEVPAGRPLSVVCRVGGRSAQATAWLVAQGIDARNVTGGMLAWAALGLPVEGDSDRPWIV